MDIRRAEPTDAQRLAALGEATFRATFESFNRRENIDAYCEATYGPALQAAEIADPRIETFVSGDDAGLVGFAQLRFGTAPPCVAAAAPAEICRIYVGQRCHGQGIAQALMARLLAAARERNADRVWLGVWEHNQRAIAFYRKFGFTIAGHHDFKLGDDLQKDWVMCCDLRAGPANGSLEP